MTLYVTFLVLAGNYLVLNEKIEEGSKIAALAVGVVIFLLMLLF